MINNRQAGRRRGRGGNNGAGGGGGGNPRQGGNPGRGDGGNRIDSRARGNAAQMLEKYKNLARDAQLSGDRVNIEYYLQFADHYFRVLSEQRSRFEESQPRRQQGDSFDDGYDGEGEDEFGQEGEPIRAGEQGAMRGNDQGRQDGRQDGQRGDGNRNDGNRSDGNRGEGQRNDGQRSYEPRDAQPRGDGQRNGGDQPQRGADRPARNADGERRPQGGEQVERRPRRERYEQSDAPPREAAPAEEAPAATFVPVAHVAEDAPAEAPRRRGRPRREVAPVEEAATFEADRLPQSLGLSAVANDTDAADDAPKPRRAAPHGRKPPLRNDLIARVGQETGLAWRGSGLFPFGPDNSTPVGGERGG